MIWLFLLFSVVPFIELYLLLLIGQSIGAAPTILIVILTAIWGAYLAKHEGREVILRIQQELSIGLLPADSLIEALIIFASGILLITPGVITDSIALLLLVFRPLRRVVIEYLKRYFRNHFTITRL